MKVVIALVYVTEVRPEEAEDPQTHTYERICSADMPMPKGCDLLYASSVLAWDGDSLDAFDGDVDVRSNGRRLEAVEYPA